MILNNHLWDNKEADWLSFLVAWFLHAFPFGYINVILVFLGINN
jgi:hypothetical protein